MAQGPYSEKVMDHFMHPRNMGEIEEPSGVGEVGNPACGDVMRLYLKIEWHDHRCQVQDVRVWRRNCVEHHDDGADKGEID